MHRLTHRCASRVKWRCRVQGERCWSKESERCVPGLIHEFTLRLIYKNVSTCPTWLCTHLRIVFKASSFRLGVISQQFKETLKVAPSSGHKRQRLLLPSCFTKDGDVLSVVAIALICVVLWNTFIYTEFCFYIYIYISHFVHSTCILCTLISVRFSLNYFKTVTGTFKKIHDNCCNNFGLFKQFAFYFSTFYFSQWSCVMLSLGMLLQRFDGCGSFVVGPTKRL